MTTLFISDLHLSAERPDKLVLFRQLLRGPARRAEALYILGDLFEEFWVGIDDTTPPNPEIVQELTEFTRSGSSLFIQKGNRELLLDRKFGELTGAVILPDQAIIDLDGERVLLMHGDLLCTRDWKYQVWRHLITFTLTRKVFGWLPYRTRILLAHGLRPALKRSTMRKPAAIMDVHQGTVERILQSSKVSTLIHGHTHRPGLHQYHLAGGMSSRLVLGDWYDDARILVCNGADKKLIPVSEYLQNN